MKPTARPLPNAAMTSMRSPRRASTTSSDGGYLHPGTRLRSPVFSDDEMDQLDDEDEEIDGSDTETDSDIDSPRDHPNGKSHHSLSTILNHTSFSSSSDPPHDTHNSSLRLPPIILDSDATSKVKKLPPIYTQFMREFSATPAAGGPGQPNPLGLGPDPSSVPSETCQELLRQRINPHWVVMPRFGDPCPFSHKPSCLRTDWRPAMWERHVQTHLPDSMKEFWECPHCFRPFNRKCAWVNHLKKTRTECGVKGTLDMFEESMWKDKFFHEPMPLRHPDEGPSRRKWHQYHAKGEE